MKTNTHFLIILFLALNHVVKSQPDSINDLSSSLFFAEIGGHGGYGSLNYQHLLLKKNKFKLSGSTGIGTYHLYDYQNKLNPDIIITLGISSYYGNKNNIEIGVAQTISSIIYADNLTYNPKRKHDLNTNLTFGYRYQKEQGGFVYRISYTPIIEKNKFYRNWFGMSFGYAF